MKTRKLKVLLTLLKDNIITANHFISMCHSLLNMFYRFKITFQEYIKVSSYLRKHKYINGYWFPKGEKQPRIEWLDKQINKPWYLYFYYKKVKGYYY